MIITSFSNPKIKSIRKLEKKKYRQESGLFFIEGLRIVGEAVQLAAPIHTIVVSPELLESDFGLSLLIHPNIVNVERIDVSAEVFKKIANKEGPQGIGAVVQQNWQALDTTPVHTDDIWVALDAVADPGNLGTIMRTLDAVGGRGVILLGHTTDPYDPTAVKASMGALLSLELVQADWSEFLRWRADKSISMIGTSDHAEKDYQAIKYQHPLILFMGSERHGLSDEMEDACDQMARIPMAGRGDSLNLAVATAVMLYEIFNQSRNLVTIEP